MSVAFAPSRASSRAAATVRSACILLPDAAERIRTSTLLRAHGSEPCLSTSSNTAARRLQVSKLIRALDFLARRTHVRIVCLRPDGILGRNPRPEGPLGLPPVRRTPGYTASSLA